MEQYLNRKIIQSVFKEYTYNSLTLNSIVSDNNQRIKEIFKNKLTTQKNKYLLFCILCCIIYKYNTTFYNIISSWELNTDNFKVINIDDGELVYGIYKFDNNIVYFFKGSSSIKDFLSNIQFSTTRDTLLAGKVHTGFHGILAKDSRYLDIIKGIISLPKNVNIYLTGHSLGAALASILKVYIDNILNRQTFLVTFGCPRVGDSRFSKQVSDSVRIVNENDCVTKLPLPISYIHFSKKMLLGKECISSFSVKDHSIDSYFEKLLV
jgi:triacylglycerol lipase